MVTATSNAGIVGGYNNQSGFPYQDALNYHYGLGISPYGRLAGTKVFNNSANFDLSMCDSYITAVANAYDSGALITSNSWGGRHGWELQRICANLRRAHARRLFFLKPGNQAMLTSFPRELSPHHVLERHLPAQPKTC